MPDSCITAIIRQVYKECVRNLIGPWFNNEGLIFDSI